MLQPTRNIPIDTDITVAGGGLAGVCAAIAAARQGRSVSLIQNRPVLGGNSSSEIRVWTRGSTGGGNLFSEEMGILGELKLANQYKNPEGNPHLWDEILLDAVYQEPNISLYLNTMIIEVEHTEGHINALKALELHSERHFVFSSLIYVDATGDGFVAASTELAYVIGKESSETYGEPHAPKQFDPTTQGCTILMTLSKRDRKIPFIAPSYAYPIEHIEKLLNTGGRIVTEKSNGCDFWWIEFGGEKDTINGIAGISFELKRLALGIYNYIKNSGKYDADTLELTWIGNLPGKRESRRFLTEYVLTESDILESREFEDVVFNGGWYLDYHPSQGIYSKNDFCTQIPVASYGVPLRSLFSLKSDNLLLCGRIIGTSHAAFASTRIMNTCALSGQASGTAASILASESMQTKALLEPRVVEKIQTILRDDDMLLVGNAQQPIQDTLSCEVSSVIESLPGAKCGSLACTQDCFLAIPAELAQHSSLLLDVEKNTMLHFSYQYRSLPSRNSKQKQWYDDSLVVEKGRNAFDLAPFAKLEGYLVFVLHAKEGVSIPLVDQPLIGVVCGKTSSATYYNPLLDIRCFASYGAHNLSNGYTRPYNKANIWISGKEEYPSIRIACDGKRLVSSLTLFFDCGLSEEMVSTRTSDIDAHHNISLRSGVSPNLVRDFDVYARVGDEDELVGQIRDNYQRHVKVAFDRCETDSLFIRFLKTHGAPYIGVYEIQIH